MIKTVLLTADTMEDATPILKNYNYKETVIVINKHTNATELISAEKLSQYDHLILSNERIRSIISIMSSEEGITKEQMLQIVNNMMRE